MKCIIFKGFRLDIPVQSLKLRKAGTRRVNVAKSQFKPTKFPYLRDEF